jgi:ABC-type transporter Mla MlaB component
VAAPEQSRTSRFGASRAPVEASTITLVIGTRVARADIPVLCARVPSLLNGTNAELIECDMSALIGPDAATVDALARLQLTARRLGAEVWLSHASLELQELLGLMGLRDAVPLCDRPALEAREQTEQRKERLGVEEERDPGDLSA